MAGRAGCCARRGLSAATAPLQRVQRPWSAGVKSPPSGAEERSEVVLLPARSQRRTPRGLALLLAFLTGVVGIAAAADLAALDAQDGFRDARFGAAFESFEGLELLTDRAARGSTLYVRPGDELRLGEATLDGVTYGFHAGRLYFVILFTSGERNARATLAELERAYGAGVRGPGEALEYVWRGRGVLLHYRVDPATSMGMVSLTSLRVDARVASELGASHPASAE